MENSTLSTGARCPTAETNTLEIYTAPHCDLFDQVKKMKTPKGIDRLISQHPRAWFAPNIGHLRTCSLCCKPVWLVPASPRAVTLAASETPTVTVAVPNQLAVPVPSQRTEQHMEGLGSPPSAESGQDSACNSDLRQCSIMISTAQGLLASHKDSVNTGMVRSHTAHIAWPQPLSDLSAQSSWSLPIWHQREVVLIYCWCLWSLDIHSQAVQHDHC